MTYGLHRLATPAQIQAYVRSEWTRFRHFASTVGETSAFILLVIMALYLLFFLVRTGWRACHLFPRHGVNKRSLLAAISMSQRLYNAWYSGEEPLPGRAGRQVPPARERQRIHALSDNLDKHLAGKEARRQKRNSPDFGASIISKSASTSTSEGIFTDNDG